jgi:hypothetical protein
MTTYMLSVCLTQGATPPPDDVIEGAMKAVDDFNTKLQDQGVWVFAGGLHPVETATVVDGTKGGDVLITDGPFAEAKEHLGGFWVIKVPDLDTALALAAEGSKACLYPIEVRPFEDDVV